MTARHIDRFEITIERYSGEEETLVVWNSVEVRKKYEVWNGKKIESQFGPQIGKKGDEEGVPEAVTAETADVLREDGIDLLSERWSHIEVIDLEDSKVTIL